MKRNRSIVKLAFERDGGRCRNCNEPATAAHHVIPLAFGGTDALSNLICLCDACHYAAHRGMAVTQVKNTLEVGVQIPNRGTHVDGANSGRSRQGRQLAIEVEPDLLRQLKEYASKNDTTMAATVRHFIVSGLQETESICEDSLDVRIAWLESQVLGLISSSAFEKPVKTSED